jgi:hypothetical protein
MPGVDAVAAVRWEGSGYAESANYTGLPDITLHLVPRSDWVPTVS